MAIEITSPVLNATYSAELGLNVKWTGSEGHAIVNVYWGGFDNPIERTSRHSDEGDADYGNVTIRVPDSIRPIVGSLPCWIQISGMPQSSSGITFYMEERPTLKGITVKAPMDGQPLDASVSVGYFFSGNDQGVTGTVRVNVASSNYMKSYGSATYSGRLDVVDGFLSIPIDMGDVGFDANAHIVATVNADSGYIGTSYVTDVKLAQPAVMSLSVDGSIVDDGSTVHITDWPLRVIGSIMDYVDGANAPIMFVRVSTESGYANVQVRPSGDGSFSFELDGNNIMPLVNGDMIWLEVRVENSLGIEFFHASGKRYVVDIHAPSIGSASFEDVLSDGSVKVTYYAYDDDPLTPNPISGTIYAEKPDGTVKVLRSWNQADWDATQGVITAVNEFAAVNQPTRYIFECVSSAGEKSSLTAYHTLVSPYFYMHWGQGRGANAVVTSARWNPEATWSVKPSNVELISYMGRTLPVMARSKAVEDTTSFSFTVLDMKEAELIRRLVASYGRCYYRGADGVVCHAYIEAQAKPRYTFLSKHAEVSVSMTKIDGSIR